MRMDCTDGADGTECPFRSDVFIYLLIFVYLATYLLTKLSILLNKGERGGKQK